MSKSLTGAAAQPDGAGSRADYRQISLPHAQPCKIRLFFEL